MSILTRFSGTKYNDKEITKRAQVAVDEDPLLASASDVTVTSEKGVITVSGKVRKEAERDRIEGVIRSTLRGAGLKHEKIVNALEIRH